jgi:hypothetical protein
MVEFFVSDAPVGEVYRFVDPPDCATKELMEFHLTYWGEMILASGRSNSRMWEKHQIRLYLHNQLKTLWETHKSLAGGLVMHPENAVAEHYEGYVPVVLKECGMLCELDILFLRAEPIGSIIKRDSGGGDLDNRMKTLLDALCIPQRGGCPPKEPNDPDPVFVLMSDDELITSLKITAGRLLTPPIGKPSSAEACVVIRAKVSLPDPLHPPYGFKMPPAKPLPPR